MEYFLLSKKDLKVSLIRLSGNGTLKQGDSLNLTCDVNCTHSSSQFVWSTNNEQLKTSGPVLYFPALTVRDSGNYTCTWKSNETSGSKTISLQVEGDWGVKYPELVCAVRGSSVSIPCSYYYPKGIQVAQMLWCSMNSNKGRCTDFPYVYNSLSNIKSHFEYVGDDKSNCTLLIHNAQFSYSGEYRFRFITDWIDGEWTGEPGVTLQVADLKVSLIRLSGNGTLKQGDSINLKCDMGCTHSSSQFVWSKNNKQLNPSGPVLHLPALTVRDSGNYTCTWKTKETSGSKTISLQVEGDWGVKYPELVCAVRGSSVSIPCSYYYPKGIQVAQMLWCSMNLNKGRCTDLPYVYNSLSNIKSHFEYVGDDKSNCTLLINNAQFSYSGEYRFRFITDWIDGEWTGEPGVTLQVADVKVSLIRLSGNRTLKQGDSLNLTCDVNCTNNSSQFVWSKNNEQLNPSGPVVHFPALTVRDSGNYTCTWKTNETSGSKTISLQVEEYSPNFVHWSVWIVVGVTTGVSVIISVFLGAVIYSRRNRSLHESRSVHTEEQKEDDSQIYANVQQMEDNSDIYANVYHNQP
ncbi:sialoadhesin-like isoform X1 [Clarias gariepinus]|uniref:sialoadhesin-like isoform X1 n=1 Tax=Clarias gariepinus TaxID=13013 RepID=UPI00234C450A|nr:sialoadhesin-like isoform X1 [Clarias gariepinus]